MATDAEQAMEEAAAGSTDVSGVMGVAAGELTNKQLKEWCEGHAEPDSVKSLVFRGCVQLTSLAGVEKFAALEQINCQYCYALTDFKALGKCAELAQVTLNYVAGNYPTTDLESYCVGHGPPTKRETVDMDLLAPLKECKQLKELNIQNSFGINEQTQMLLRQAVPGLKIKKSSYPSSSWTALYAQ